MSSSHRGLWVFFQALSSIALGFLFYTIYLVIDGLTGHAINAWFASGVSWGLGMMHISSTTLDALLEGQNIVGVATSLAAIFVFFMSTRPRQPGRP
jgi:hypothetical protein